MPVFDIKDYDFNGLRCALGSDEDPTGDLPSLCYLIGLVNSPAHKISEPQAATRILSWLYETEEQAQDASRLREAEEFFSRYFPGGYHPTTPCMVVRRWSPISAMLQRGFQPQVLNREPRFLAVATGIWDPRANLEEKEIDSAPSDEDLFWAIIATASRRAVKQRAYLSIIARPGWDYESAIDSLPDWLPEEVAKSGRVLWKRTPEG